MKELKDITELNQMKAEGNYVFYFTATWCPDCTVIEPHLPSIEKEFSDYTFIKVDRDEFVDLCQEWNIFGIPSFVVMKDGLEQGRFVDKNRKTKNEIVSFLSHTIK